MDVRVANSAYADGVLDPVHCVFRGLRPHHPVVRVVRFTSASDAELVTLQSEINNLSWDLGHLEHLLLHASRFPH